MSEQTAPVTTPVPAPRSPRPVTGVVIPTVSPPMDQLIFGGLPDHSTGPLAPGPTAERHQSSLVAFLPAGGGSAEPGATGTGPDRESTLRVLCEAAVTATDVCFVITDARLPDNPIAWVNRAFTRVTGYATEDIVGRNCRILQSVDSDPSSVAELRAAIAEQRSTTVTLLNRRRDGSEFWNELTMTPVTDGDGLLIAHVGVQIDVTERVRADLERISALAAEQEARHTAEHAQDRLQLMAEGTSQLAATLDTGDLLRRLVGLCVPMLAHWAYAVAFSETGDLLDTGAVTSAAAAHAEGHEAELERWAASLLGWPVPIGSAAAASVVTGRPQMDTDTRTGDPVTVFRTAPERVLAADLGLRSVLTIPMVARGRTLGVLTLVSPFRPPAGDDVDVAADLGRRAATAMDNARLYQQELSIAETLQRSLLPDLPALAGVSVHAHYQAASSTAAVGGDFYDVIDLPDGSVALAIGDVAGHDINAAAQMGQLRGLLRACAYEAPNPDPAAVLNRLDRLLLGLGLQTLATVAYARAWRRPGAPDSWVLQVASAGHPPLVLLAPDGTVRQVDEAQGLMLGVMTGRPRTSVTLDVARGTTVLAYTDGLVEHRGLDLDEGTDELLGLLAELGPHPDPERITQVAMTMADNRLDDVACISVTLL